MYRSKLSREVRVNLRLSSKEMVALTRAAKRSRMPITTFARLAAIAASATTKGGVHNARP